MRLRARSATRGSAISLAGPRRPRRLFPYERVHLYHELYLHARPHQPRRPALRGAGGCLMRMMLVIVLLFVALVSAVFLFGRALLY